MGIVRAARGGIRVDSAPETGTVFDIYLPCSEAIAAAPDKDRLLDGGTDRILFADGELLFVDLASESIGALGCRLEAVQDSQEALARFSRAPQDFDLMITDQTMPMVTGLQLAVQIHSIRADVPIILCTGYSETIAKRPLQDAGIRRVLLKPVSRREMVRAIREVLDATPVDRSGTGTGPRRTRRDDED